MNIIQLSQHVFKCEFKIDVPIHIPVSCSFLFEGHFAEDYCWKELCG